MHPDWNPNVERYDADVAVIVLNNPLHFNEYIQPVCLIQPSSPETAIRNGLVVGYGKSEDDSKLHENIPKVLEMPIHDDADCYREFSSLAKYATNRTLCAGNNGTSVCVGDSGGGLYVQHNGLYYVRGIISASIRELFGCNPNTYSLFTDVPKFNDWINNVPLDQSYG